jgi:DNA polymerase III sliding clamp (beta) subunit (PCNA family)
MNIDKRFKLEKCVSTDPSRVRMQNVHVTRRHAFATNGHILAAVPVESQKDDSEGWLTVDALKLARKVTPKDSDHISIILNGQQILSDGTTLARPETVESFPRVGHLLLQTLRHRTLRIGVNADYLKNLALALGSEEIILEIGKPDTAIAVRPVHDNGAVGVIMPIRLNSR